MGGLDLSVGLNLETEEYGGVGGAGTDNLLLETGTDDILLEDGLCVILLET